MIFVEFCRWESSIDTCLFMYIFCISHTVFLSQSLTRCGRIVLFFLICYVWSFPDFPFFDSQTFVFSIMYVFRILTRSQTDSHLMICFEFLICFSHSGFPTQDSHTNFSASNKFDAGKNPTRFLSFRVECRRVRWRSVEKMEWIADPEVGFLLRNGLP